MRLNKLKSWVGRRHTLLSQPFAKNTQKDATQQRDGKHCRALSITPDCRSSDRRHSCHSVYYHPIDITTVGQSSCNYHNHLLLFVCII